MSGVWYNLSGSSNILKSSYINGFMDVSSLLISRGDASMAGNLFVGGPVNVNNSMGMSGVINQMISTPMVGNVVYFGGNTVNDSYLGGRLLVTGDSSLNSNLYVSGVTIFNGDSSMNNKLYVGGDVSINRRLFVASDISTNSNLYVGGDVNVNGMLRVKQYATNLTVYTVSYEFIVVEDMSLNGRLCVSGDVSMNKRLFVGGDTQIGGNLTLSSSNVRLGSGSGTTNQGTNAIAIGNTAGNSSQSVGSIAIGQQAGQISQGSYSVAIGTYSGYSQSGTNNTYIGNESGYDSGVSRTGSNNTYIGYGTNANASYNKSTAIGYNAMITGSNQIMLGTSMETIVVPGTEMFSTGTSSSTFVNNAGTTIVPNSTAATSASWTANGVTWTASASSNNSVTSNPYMAFDNNVGADVVRWAAATTSYSTTSPFAYNTTTYGTSILISGTSTTVYGEWLQISSSTALCLNSFAFTPTGTTSANLGYSPKTFYIVGATVANPASWTPIIYGNFTELPYPSATTQASTPTYIVTGGSGSSSQGVLSTTSYGNATSAFTYFRMVITNVIGSTGGATASGWLGIGELNLGFKSQSTGVSQSILTMDSTNYKQLNVNGSLAVSGTITSTRNAPQITTLTSGSGTYITPTNASYLMLRMIGGGGGGGGGGSGTKGGDGGNTVFGSYTANGGAGGAGNDGGASGAGGSSTGSPNLTIPGGNGGYIQSSSTTGNGGCGGNGVFGGGSGGNFGSNDGKINTGGGGGGGFSATSGSAWAGAGGGAGGYVEHVFNTPLSLYTYSVGSGGTGGAINVAGSNKGGTGGSGIIIITAYF